MNIRYFDAHCHIQFDAYKEDGLELIQRMQGKGVGGVVVGVEEESSRKAIEFAEAHENLVASVGLHPNRVMAEEFSMDVYRALAVHPKVVAIGECGLDYFRPVELTDEVKEKQKKILRLHIALAVELDKPLIVHSRPSKGTQDAYRDLIHILTEEKIRHPSLRGDIHFFVGGVEEMQELTRLGFTLSFTAVITFAREYDEVIRAAPLAMILAETDAPYVAPLSRRGQRNDPLAVEEVVAKIAHIRGEDEETVRKALLANASRIFGVVGPKTV